MPTHQRPIRSLQERREALRLPLWPMQEKVRISYPNTYKTPATLTFRSGHGSNHPVRADEDLVLFVVQVFTTVSYEGTAA